MQIQREKEPQKQAESITKFSWIKRVLLMTNFTPRPQRTTHKNVVFKITIQENIIKEKKDPSIAKIKDFIRCLDDNLSVLKSK